MQTWSFASQSNDELLLSAIPAVLAVLLRTLSNVLELSQRGLGICRTLLQKSQLELIARALTVTKGKTFILSPILRLLNQLAIFDGGDMAKQVFRARDHTLKGLARNLHLRVTGEEVEDRKKPSARTNALRFLLSLLKFLPVEGKRELLYQRDIVTAVTKDIKDDPPFLVCEILETLKTYVLHDEKLPRDAKAKLLNANSLGRIAMLYGYDQPDEELTKSNKSVEVIAHDFLVLACMSPELGALNRQAGFYPRGIDPDDTEDFDDDQALLDLGLDSVEWMDKFTDKVPIRNTILSDFIQTLRPWSNAKQRDLILSIFASAPELVAEYFFNRKSFSFEPKLTATWIGYSAFLFSSLQLPLPKYFGHQHRYARLPPPPSIVLESILPQPLSQKVLRRCLLQPQKLITFFAIRILSVAFSKFQTALRMYEDAASGSSSLWAQAAASLTDAFSKRCPSIKDVIHAFRNMSDTDLLQREAATRLLVLYYEVVPSTALDAKFDVSAVLTQRLHSIEGSQLSPGDRSMCAMELENLFQFAHFSPGMRWFSKAEGLHISPFMAMLKLSAEAPTEVPLLKLNSVLTSISEENQILQTQTSISVLESFILVLSSLRGTPNAPRVYEFLDDCISRCAAKPIKYIFGLEEINSRVHGANHTSSPFSLLTLVIAKQWPFIIKSASDLVLQEIAQFVASYLATLLKIKEDKKIIKDVIQQLAVAIPEDSSARSTIEGTRKLVDTIAVPERKSKHLGELEKNTNKSNAPSESDNMTLTTTMLEDTDTRADDSSSLVRWVNKNVEEVVGGGHAAALVMLLSSELLSARKEAATNISKFAAKLKESTYEEKDQIWLLLSEVVDTAKTVIDQEPLPTVISAFASHAIPVLSDPLHHLYPKINSFLSQGPTWEVDKIPLMYKIFDEPPSFDDAYYQETNWLLTYLLVGLRSPADMAIYRKRRAFEKLLSIWNNTYLAPGVREKILRILFRATTIEGGSTTLITRFSSTTWLEAQIALGTGMSLKALMERILESSDPQRVRKWSKGVNVSAVKADTMKF
jgi:nucleolar pre-ribosomal-associated protein 1